MEHLTTGQRPPTGQDDEPTYRCHSCLDSGYVSHEVAKRGDRCSLAWFCDCPTGRATHAGYWFDAIYQQSGNTRVHSDRGQRRLAEYLAARPGERIWLLGAVEHLREKHESQRRRKLSQIEAD